MPAEDGGLLCLVDETGRVSVRHNDQPLAIQSSWAIARLVNGDQLPEVSSAVHRDEVTPLERTFEGTLEVIVETDGLPNLQGDRQITARAQRDLLMRSSPRRSTGHLSMGSIALVSHLGAKGARAATGLMIWTSRGICSPWIPTRSWGPVLMTQYTIDDGVLNLTAQLPPLGCGR